MLDHKTLFKRTQLACRNKLSRDEIGRMILYILAVTTGRLNNLMGLRIFVHP